MNHEEKLALTRNYLAAFASENCISEEAHLLRETAVQELPKLLLDFDEAELPLDLVCCAYMLCSYCEHPDKHAVKPVIMEFFRRELQKKGLTDFALPPKSTGRRPRIAVFATFMKSNHTMYRVYAKALAEMKKRFHLTGIVFTPMDEAGAALFDHVIIVPPQAVDFYEQLAKISGIVRELAPAAIVYADTAMHPISTALSSIRMAPLQILWAGHPSSSYSPAMDFFMCEDFFARSLADYTEHRALVPTNRCAFTPLEKLSLPRFPRESGPQRIIIPGVLPKITHPFLKAVKRIASQLPGDHEIHITTGADAQRNFPLVADQLRAIIPALKVYPKLPYEHYLALIDNCDMFLNPWPFGGCSTVMDCVTRGLPGVSMTGTEIFATQGPMVMHRCGLPDPFTIATTEREYIARAINLAVNAPLRRALAENLRRTAPDQFPVFTDRADGFAVAISTLLTRESYRPFLARPVSAGLTPA